MRDKLYGQKCFCGGSPKGMVGGFHQSWCPEQPEVKAAHERNRVSVAPDDDGNLQDGYDPAYDVSRLGPSQDDPTSARSFNEPKRSKPVISMETAEALLTLLHGSETTAVKSVQDCLIEAFIWRAAGESGMADLIERVALEVGVIAEANHRARSASSCTIVGEPPLSLDSVKDSV